MSLVFIGGERGVIGEGCKDYKNLKIYLGIVAPIDLKTKFVFYVNVFFFSF